MDELYHQLLSLAKSTKVDSTNVLSEIDWVKSNFAKIYSGLETLKLICWKQVWGMENNVLSMTDASLAKIYGSEYFIEAYRMMMEIFGELCLFLTVDWKECIELPQSLPLVVELMKCNEISFLWQGY